jgi:hypothetical protein
MASKIRTFQARIAALLLADTAHFVAAPAPEGDLRVPVIVDLPGDIDSIVNQALAATGIACIVWTPSRAPKNEQRAKNRRYICRVWVKENVLLNRGKAQFARDLVGSTDATEFTLVDSADLVVGMLVQSYDFPTGTVIADILSPGSMATIVTSQGKLSSGTAPCTFTLPTYTAEEIAELVDELCDGKANGLTPHPRGNLGHIVLGDAGVIPIGGAEAAENDFEVTLETEALL